MVAPRSRSREDQRLEPFLIDRVEPRERLVEHEQVGLVDDRAEQLDELRHALRQLADLGVDGMAEPGVLQQLDARACARSASGRPRSAPMNAIASRAFIAGYSPRSSGR